MFQDFVEQTRQFFEPFRYNTQHVTRLESDLFMIMAPSASELLEMLGLGVYDCDTERNENWRIRLNPVEYETISTSNDDACVICTERYLPSDTVYRLDCDHIIHQKCMDEWGRYKPQCPLCRKKVQTYTADSVMDPRVCSEEMDCQLCDGPLHPGDKYCKLQCNHPFHHTCLIELSRYHKKCPICDQHFHTKQTLLYDVD